MSGKILVVDDVATNRIVMKVKLASACYEVLQATGGRQALITARRAQPDLILLDVMMPDLDGFAVCSALKSDPNTAHIPVIMVTAIADSEARLRGLQAGAEDFLTKPLDELTLLARVRSLLRRQSSPDDRRMLDQTREVLGQPRKQDLTEFDKNQRIGILSETKREGLIWQRVLAGRMGCEFVITTREAALAASKNQPDLFLIEGNKDMPSDVLQTVADLRARPASRHAALVVLLPETAQRVGAQALDQGANEVLLHGIEPEELAFRLHTQLRSKHAADQRRAEVEAGLKLAVIDPLTGLFNRRYALNHLENIATQAVRTGRDFAVMMMDFDHFKEINDKHGHSAGDQVLAEAAMRLREKLRAMDLVARLGGEEFLVVLPDTSPEQAERIADRLCKLISTSPVKPYSTEAEVNATVSIGLAMGGQRMGVTDVAALLDHADRALYVAKSSGRNRVSIAPVSNEDRGKPAFEQRAV